MATTLDIVQKLWNLCNVLRDDGITYHEYVSELTYLLFLKMARETEQEALLDEGCRWGDLLERKKTGVALLNHYRGVLLQLGQSKNARVSAIFANASTSLKEPTNLATLVTSLDELDWFSARREGLGDLYEGLLEKNANEKKSGAGQYFTPRPLIDSIVHLVKPAPGERVEDPAAGTAGFLIAADRLIKDRTDDLAALSLKEQEFQRQQAFYGMELVPDTHRLALMNLMLHGIEGDLRLGDTLSGQGAGLAAADVILTNPPFGTKKGGGLPSRDDFTFATSNKQLAFLQHVYRGLRRGQGKKKGGRAAVVVPDNVLFEGNVGAQIRADLMEKATLHTILRLPTGIFYAQGVKTNVLFFTRGESDQGNTREVWVYDMRANMPAFGKRTPLTRQHFAAFEKAFGEDPHGGSQRTDEGPEGRFRRFTREEIKTRGDSLDIAWLRDDSAQDPDVVLDPEEIAAEIVGLLQTAMAEMQTLQDELGA